MTARLADGKRAIIPRLTKSFNDDSRQNIENIADPEFAPLNVSPSIVKMIKKSMESVMTGPLGTARYHDLKTHGIAGKTGTVQVKRITKEQREAGITENIDRPWKERDHALFVAYAPRKNPRYAAVVVVEHGGSGLISWQRLLRVIF